MRKRSLAPLVLLLLPALLLGTDRPDSRAGRTLVQGPLADAARMLADVRRFSEDDSGAPRCRYCYRVEIDPLQDEALSRMRADATAGGELGFWEFSPRVERDTIPPDTNWARGVPIRTRFRNIIAHYEGSDPAAGKYVITAHFDAIGTRTPGWQPWDQPAPGADDNLSGCAAVIELHRLLAPEFAAGQIPFDIDFVMFDAEEMGLWGSDTLAKVERRAGASILGVLNMDMIGYNPRADSLVIMTNRSSGFLARYFQETEELDPQPDLRLITTTENLINSDHGPYWEQGYPAFMLIEALRVIRHNPQYHQVTDRATTISRGGDMMAMAANVILKGIRRLATAASGPPHYRVFDEDITYFVNGIAEGARTAAPGDTLRIEGGVFNAGGFAVSGVPETARFYKVVRGERHRLETRTIPALRTGEHRRLAVSTRLGPDDAGAVTVEMEIDGESGPQVARRSIPVRGGQPGLADFYVAPNPVRDLDHAALCYELTRDASVRVTLFDLHGDELGRSWFPYVRGGDSNSNVFNGLNRVPLRDLFQSEGPAPGVYLYRIEVVTGSEGSVAAATGKFAILR